MDACLLTTKSEPYVCVIGAANLDITARPKGPFVLRDSNIGKVSFSFGGVGRNIAHNLCLLGERVRFVTVFGGDANAQAIREDCIRIGMDVSDSMVVPSEHSPVYLCIHDDTGDMVAAVNDMELIRHLSGDFLFERREVLDRSRAVVFDTNLESETISRLFSCCDAPLFADTVSCVKASRLIPVLKEKHRRPLYALKANRAEAEVLLGHPITGEEEYRKAVMELFDFRVLHVYITLGAEGVIAYDGKTAVRLPCEKAKTVNATGAGDAFLSAVVHAHGIGVSFAESVRMGQRAAKISLESECAVSPLLSSQNIQ